MARKAVAKPTTEKDTSPPAPPKETPRTRAPNKPNPDSEWLKSEFFPKNLREAIKYGRSKDAARFVKYRIPINEIFDGWLEDSTVKGNREALGICFLRGFNATNGTDYGIESLTPVPESELEDAPEPELQ